MNKEQYTGIAVAAGLHIAVIALLLQLDPVRSAVRNVAPMMVDLITPPKLVEKAPEPPKPVITKPHVAKAAPPKPALVPMPILTAPAEAPSQVSAPPPPVVAAPAPVAAPEAPPAPEPAPVKAAPAPVVPPSFNAAYLNNPAPAYPVLARRTGQEGKVVLRVFVSREGSADKVEVRSSSGSSTLDNAATEAVKHWRFVPARQGDQPVNAWVLVPISFSLKG